jgi:tetratricopeptide (TPR) repeat protein
VIAARIDRLPPAAKALLQRAAVIGRYFAYRTLQAVTGEPPDLERAVATLLRTELIREWTPMPDRQYVFKHALTQEAAEASLLAEQRREIHRLVATHLESTLGDDAGEGAAVLAHHWYHAGQWERALEHTLRAAERAHGLYDRPAAIAHYWRALELFDHLPPTIERQRRHADATATLIRTPGFAQNDTVIRVGLQHLDRALAACADGGDVPRLARLQALKGYFVRDEDLVKSAVSHAEASKDPLTQAFVLDRYGAYLGPSGRLDEALTQFSRSIVLFAAQGARFQQAMNINYGGRCYSARAGRLDDSLRYAAQFRELAAEMGDARLLAWRAMEAEPYSYLGAWNDVIRVAEESLPLAWRIGETNVILFVSAWLGLACLKVGRIADARQVVDRAAEHWQVNRDATPFALTYLTTAGALTRLAAGEVTAALDMARRALDLAERSQFPMEQGAAHRALGQAHAAMSNRVEADAAFRRSLEILEDIRCWPELGQTLLAYGQFKRGDDGAEGRASIERARVMFEEIGATGWVVEAQAALE